MAESTVFLPTAHAGPVWDLAREQLSRPRPQLSPSEGVREELAVRDLMSRYAYTLDQGNLDDILQFFTDDCVINSPRGAVAGTEEIRAYFEQLFSDTPRRHHLWSNVVVRLADDLGDGRITSYFFAVLEPKNQSPRAVGGLIVDDVVKTGGEWRICARSVTFDFTCRVFEAADAH